MWKLSVHSENIYRSFVPTDQSRTPLKPELSISVLRRQCDVRPGAPQGQVHQPLPISAGHLPGPLCHQCPIAAQHLRNTRCFPSLFHPCTSSACMPFLGSDHYVQIRAKRISFIWEWAKNSTWNDEKLNWQVCTRKQLVDNSSSTTGSVVNDDQRTKLPLLRFLVLFCHRFHSYPS